MCAHLCQFTSKRWTHPVTARRVPSKWKGVGKGSKGNRQGERIKQGECTMYIVICVRVYKWMLVVNEWHQLYICIIITIGKNVVDNLNSVKVINKPCMSSRRMSLLPQATLHSDSEQFIYNWMLEDDLDLDWGNWKGAKRTRGKADKVVERTPRNYIGNSLHPGSRVGSRSGRKKTQEQRKKGIMQTKSWWGFTQKFPAVMLNQGWAEKRHGRKRV